MTKDLLTRANELHLKLVECRTETERVDVIWFALMDLKTDSRIDAVFEYNY